MFRTAATKIAHNSTIPALAGNKDIRPLQDLITAEKAVLISLQKLSVDFSKASEALRTWGLGEGDDLGDTLSSSTTILSHFSAALSQYATHGHAMRDLLKSVRTREEALDELKRRRKAVAAKADSAEKKLSKMSPEHKNMPMQTDTLNRLREEIRVMDSDIMTEEAALGDFKRSTTRAWMGLKFGGLLECCEKGTIAGEFGKLIIAEIPEETTQPGMGRGMYHGRAQTEQLVGEAHRCISEVVLSTLPSSEPRAPHNYNQQSLSIPQQGYSQDGGGFSANTETWSPHEDPHGGPPNYLASPQGLGSGHFLDTVESPTTTGPGFFSSPYSSQPQHGVPSYPEVQSHEPPSSRSVEEFGHRSGEPSGASDSSANDSRFATFPVQTRTGATGYSLHDGPPSPTTRHEPGQSFPTTVAEALNANSNEQHHVPPVRGSMDKSALTHTPTQMVYSPPPGPPPGAAAPVNPWARGLSPNQTPVGARESFISEDDVQLAYMGTADDHERNSGIGSHHDDGGNRSETRDLGEPPIDRNNRLPNEDNRFQQQHRVPPPAAEPEMDERALNAAAAREVSRELDALHFNPPSPMSMHFTDSTEPSRGRTSIPSGSPPAPSKDRETTPLIPPLAPLNKRNTSPTPNADTYGSSYGGSAPQPYSQQPQGSVPHGQPENTSFYNQLSPVEEQRASTHPSPRLNSPLPQPPTNSMEPDRPSPSLMGGNSPYQTPPEYPRSAGGSPFSKSNTSLNMPAPGTRTISAAAFRRPQPRKTSMGEGGALPETTPLSLKKRLPSSPYPQRGATAMSREPSSNYSPKHDSNPNPPPAVEEEDHYDYIGAYVDNDHDLPPPQHGAVGHANDGSQRSPGYGQGRFATDLEGNIR